jgi:hypothetical protein
MAVDVSKKLGTYKHYHYGSLRKTIASKERSSVSAVMAKYGVEVPRKVGTGTRRIVGVEYETKKGIQTMTYFNDSLLRVDQPLTSVSDLYGRTFGGVQLIVRLNANACELCGSEVDVEVHHVRKLKDVKQKYRKRGKIVPIWVIAMATLNRKTLVVCHSCHVAIHNGTLQERMF